MLYTISETALRQYRSGAKRDKDLSKDILEIKINCLILSTDIRNTRYTTCGKIYQFGKCRFEVDRENRVRRITWSDGDNLLKPEAEKLRENYKKFGLNRKGNKFIGKE